MGASGIGHTKWRGKIIKRGELGATSYGGSRGDWKRPQVHDASLSFSGRCRGSSFLGTYS